ncbi:hypothetical protein [Streptococcus suis]|uniref:hypothetical protein n=1 Tax=Streptococcus suis TaxID=1307 RepID=UPI000CF42C30|nr:hypothetical protein [Streptococcus suis]
MKNKTIFMIALTLGLLLLFWRGSPLNAAESNSYIADHSQKVELDNLTLPTEVRVGDFGQIRRSLSDSYYDLEFSLDFEVEDASVLSIGEKGDWKALKAGITSVTVLPAQPDKKQSFLNELSQKNWTYFPGVYLGQTPVSSHQQSSPEKTTFTVTVLETNEPHQLDTPIPMYRLYNPVNHEHFYTSDEHEKDYLVKIGWGNDEGIAWHFINATSNDKPVYRLYNPILKDHHYTLDKHEVNVLTSRFGWKQEGIGWYSNGNKEVHRLFHPGLVSGSHHYTLDKNEVRVLQERGWIYEGVAWYAY